MHDRFTAIIQTCVETGAIGEVTASELIAAHKHVIAQEVEAERKAAADSLRVFAGQLERDEHFPENVI